MADLRSQWEWRVLGDQTLSPAVKLTGWAVKTFANRRGEATVGVARLGEVAGRSPRTILRHIKDLEVAGYIKRVPGAGLRGPRGTTTKTILSLPVGALNPGVRDKNVTTSNDKACQNVGGWVTKTDELGDTHGVTRTKEEPFIEGAPAADRGRAARGARLEYVRSMVDLLGIERALAQTDLTHDEVASLHGPNGNTEQGDGE